VSVEKLQEELCVLFDTHTQTCIHTYIDTCVHTFLRGMDVSARELQMEACALITEYENW
jgi:hypothetical protein